MKWNETKMNLHLPENFNGSVLHFTLIIVFSSYSSVPSPLFPFSCQPRAPAHSFAHINACVQAIFWLFTRTRIHHLWPKDVSYLQKQPFTGMKNKRLSNGLLFMFTFYMEMFVMGNKTKVTKKLLTSKK